MKALVLKSEAVFVVKGSRAFSESPNIFFASNSTFCLLATVQKRNFIEPESAIKES